MKFKSITLLSIFTLLLELTASCSSEEPFGGAIGGEPPRFCRLYISVRNLDGKDLLNRKDPSSIAWENVLLQYRDEKERMADLGSQTSRYFRTDYSVNHNAQLIEVFFDGYIGPVRDEITLSDSLIINWPNNERDTVFCRFTDIWSLTIFPNQVELNRVDVASTPGFASYNEEYGILTIYKNMM